MRAIVTGSGTQLLGLSSGVPAPPPGLGAPWYVGTFCTPFAHAIDTLGALLSEAESLGITSSAVYQQAKARHEQETSFFAFRRSDPLLPATCTKETNDVIAVIQALNAEVKGAGGKGIVPPSEEKPDTLVRFAIVGGIIVAGVIGVAYITGQLAPLLRVIKR